ncbi:MAG: hypothetical protein AAFU77_05810 [Myxococcota bacterium]
MKRTLVAILAISCSSSPPGPTEEDLAGETYEVGQPVEAKYPANGSLKKGKVHDIYGPVAQIDFANRRRHWVSVKDLEPAGAVRVAPEGDECAFAVEDRVMAIRSKSGRTLSGKLLSSMQAGTVKQTYGKIAQVEFKDGGLDWAYCAQMRVNDKPEEDPKAASGSAGGVSSSGEKPCVFRPDTGKYVVCQTFTGGKCTSGTRACKPPTNKCTYRPEEGKYVQCQTFSSGKCRSGTRACTPPRKCMFSAKKGKYISCRSVVKGQCTSGSRACEPS